MASTLQIFRAISRLIFYGALGLSGAGLSGCKSNPPAPSDASLTNSIQAQITGDSALTGMSIDTVVSGGVATLSGTVNNDAQRTIAARDAAAIPGVKEVVNTISIYSPASARNAAPAPAVTAPDHYPAASPSAKKMEPPPKISAARQPAPIERYQPAYNSSTYTPPTATSPPTQSAQPVQKPVAAPPPPPPPPAPTFKTVTIASGDTLPVRINQTLDSATTQPDTTFSGVLASDILADGLVAIPAGSTVSGHVDVVQEAAHFKGAALLTVSLVSVTRRGEHLSVTTDPYTVKGKGRGANTAEKTGGGAAVGAILGGIFGGGRGAAIGAAAGGGVGAGSNGVTRGEQVQIESESVVRFRLASPVSVRVRTDNAAPANTDPTLERRPGN